MKDISKGYIALFRQFVEWEWYDDANTMRLFIHCLLLANYTDKKWRGKTIKRGSFITSQAKLAHSLKLSIKQIRGSLNKLKMTGEVAVLTTPEHSIITVKNYDYYQGEGRQTVTQMSQEGQTEGRQRATTNKDNNSNISYINISLSIEERETLKKYILSKPRKEPIQDWDAYFAIMNKNGTLRDKLEKAKKWLQAKEEKEKKKQGILKQVQNDKGEGFNENRSNYKEILKKGLLKR